MGLKGGRLIFGFFIHRGNKITGRLNSKLIFSNDDLPWTLSIYPDIFVGMGHAGLYIIGQLILWD
jgi:hypothetical protein